MIYIRTIKERVTIYALNNKNYNKKILIIFCGPFYISSEQKCVNRIIHLCIKLLFKKI